MEEVEFKLSQPAHGIDTFVFYAPTRKKLKFAVRIKGAIMAAALKTAETKIVRDRQNDQSEKPEIDKSPQEEGDSMWQMLLLGDRAEDILDDFVTNCTNSPMCQANGGPVAADVWDKVLVSDTEKAFGAFLGNFITI